MATLKMRSATLLAQFNSKTETAELMKETTNYIDTGSKAGLYFFEYENGRRLNSKQSNE